MIETVQQAQTEYDAALTSSKEILARDMAPEWVMRDSVTSDAALAAHVERMVSPYIALQVAEAAAFRSFLELP